MKKTLLLERVMDQVRLAVIEEGMLCEIYIRQPDSWNLTGNIYVGVVKNVMRGMNSAFVDIGLEKNALLGAGDIPASVRDDRDLTALMAKENIRDLAKPGMQMLVQVVRSQPGAKGPRVSCHITLPGRLMVLLAEVRHIGISRKIASADERDRLYRIAGQITQQGDHGLILRTAAEGSGAEALAAEYEQLCQRYEAMQRAAENLSGPRLLHDDNDLLWRVGRDMLNDDVQAVWTEGIDCCEDMRNIAAAVAPRYIDRIREHSGDTPLFDLYRVDRQIDNALQKRVWLRSGAELVIEQTEALTAIDVNTAKNAGRQNADDTILQTNLEAATEVMRQLRLRDVGGIVIVDFIDMRCPEDREVLMGRLREYAARDSEHVRVVDMTPLGLVELTRKRSRQSLQQQLMGVCDRCDGRGAVFSDETLARRAIREIQMRRRTGDTCRLLLEAPGPVCNRVRQIGLPTGGEVVLKDTREQGRGDYRLSTMI